MVKAARGENGERGQPAIDIPAPPPKPRKIRWTVMSDRGLPLGMQEDIMDVVEDIVDHVKSVDHMGHLERLSVDFTRQKNAQYKARGLSCFPGGIPFEIAYLQGTVEAFFNRLPEIGFDGVEISDDTLPTFPLTERAALIKQARDLGLEVFSGTGKKFGDGPTSAQDIIDCVKSDLDAGSTKVTVENADLLLFLKDDPGEIEKIVAGVGIDDILFEVGPNGWPDLAVFLLKELGPDINLENMEWDKMIPIESMRRGLHRQIGYTFLHDLQS